MYFLDFSLDNISLMALTIAIGFVIDDAVIIIENITRLIQEGEEPIDAALKGTRQMGFTVASITLALIAGLIPVLFMPDIVGRLFREFGMTLVAAIVASAIVSLTLTPMMCGQLLGPREQAVEPGRISRFCGQAIDRVVGWYVASLDWSLRFRWVTLLFAAALTAADGRVVRQHSQGISADPGHRHFARQDSDPFQHLFQCDEGTSAIRGCIDRGRPGRGKRRLVDRPRGHERWHRCW